MARHDEGTRALGHTRRLVRRIEHCIDRLREIRRIPYEQWTEDPSIGEQLRGD